MQGAEVAAKSRSQAKSRKGRREPVRVSGPPVGVVVAQGAMTTRAATGAQWLGCSNPKDYLGPTG